MGNWAERSKVETRGAVCGSAGEGEGGVVTRLRLRNTERRIDGSDRGGGGCASGTRSGGDLSIRRGLSGVAVGHSAAFGLGDVLGVGALCDIALSTAALGGAALGRITIAVGSGHGSRGKSVAIAQGWGLRS